MVVAVAANQMDKLADPVMLRGAALPTSLVIEQSQFLAQIAQQALTCGTGLTTNQITFERISRDIIPQLKSTLDTVLAAVKPSIALEQMQNFGIFREFGELDNLAKIPQDPIWHPEGTAWVHTMMVVDYAAMLSRSLPIKLSPDERQGIMWGALLHDIGKSLTTQTRNSDGRIISPKHEEAGVEPARAILELLEIAPEVARVACAIVREHMAPPALFRELCRGQLNPESYARAVSRLAKRIEPVRLEPLLIAAMADRLGRSTPESPHSKIAFSRPMAEILEVSITEFNNHN